MKIVLASDNGNKLREFRELLAGSGVEILSKTEAGLPAGGRGNGG